MAAGDFRWPLEAKIYSRNSRNANHIMPPLNRAKAIIAKNAPHEVSSSPRIPSEHGNAAADNSAPDNPQTVLDPAKAAK